MSTDEYDELIDDYDEFIKELAKQLQIPEYILTQPKDVWLPHILKMMDAFNNLFEEGA